MTDPRLALLWQRVEEFASREWQERVWIRGEGPEVSSYEEAMCGLFDDAQMDDLLDNALLLTNSGGSQRQALYRLREMLVRFGGSVPEISSPHQVLNDPAWDEVRAAAQAAISARQNSCAEQ